MSLIDLSYPNESVLNPAHLFGHVRKSETELRSMISVKGMCLSNKDAFAAGIVSDVVFDQDLYSGKEDLYMRGAAYSLALLEDVEKYQGVHCGDCTKMCSSCETCICEYTFTNGLSNLSYFEDLIQTQDESLHLERFDRCILFMTVAQFEEEYWANFTNYHRENHPSLPTCDVDAPTYFDSLRRFLALPEEQQNEKYERMKKVREYIEYPTPIEGIPWW